MIPFVCGPFSAAYAQEIKELMPFLVLPQDYQDL